MTIEDLQSICKKFPGLKQDIKWENHLCFNVHDKMFIVTSPDTFPITASFKVSDDEFDEISSREGFKPAPYMARHKWVYVDNINRLSKKEWTRLAKEAYNLIGSKLPAKTKKLIKFEMQ